MPTIEGVTLRDIASAIADKLQLSDAELQSVSQITVSVTYQIDRQAKQDDWMDEWYESYKQREVIPF